jgi:hypothetical protein
MLSCWISATASRVSCNGCMHIVNIYCTAYFDSFSFIPFADKPTNALGPDRPVYS